MSRERVTPKQAFDAIVVLWPWVKSISPGTAGSVAAHRTVYSSESSVGERIYVDIASEVVWGQETQYPAPPPRYRPAKFPEDWGKECRAKFPWVDKENAWVYGHKIIGYFQEPSTDKMRWLVSSVMDGSQYSSGTVEVEDTPDEN